MRRTSSSGRVLDDRHEAHSVQRHLDLTVEFRWECDFEQIEQGGKQIDRMEVLMAQSSSLNPSSRHNEWVADAAFEGVALPPPQGCVAGQGPTPGVVTARAEAAEIAIVRKLIFDVVCFVGDVVPQLVVGAVRTPLSGSPVVGDHHHDRVLQLAGLFEVGEDPTNLMVGVADEPGTDLHHPCVKSPTLFVDFVPGLHP